MASSFEQRPTLDPYQRALPPREASYPDHCFKTDLRGYEGSQEHNLSTLKLPYNNVPLVRKGTPNERNGSASNETGVDQRCN
jgi:hypothetical protein